MLQRLNVLGSTESIGDSTLEVVARYSDAFVVYALSAHRDMRKLFQQCLKFHPALAIGSEPRHAPFYRVGDGFGPCSDDLLILEGLWHRARPKRT